MYDPQEEPDYDFTNQDIYDCFEDIRISIDDDWHIDDAYEIINEYSNSLDHQQSDMFTEIVIDKVKEYCRENSIN